MSLFEDTKTVIVSLPALIAGTPRLWTIPLLVPFTCDGFIVHSIVTDNATSTYMLYSNISNDHIGAVSLNGNYPQTFFSLNKKIINGNFNFRLDNPDGTVNINEAAANIMVTIEFLKLKENKSDTKISYKL